MITEVLFYLLMLSIPVFACLSIRSNANLRVVGFFIVTGIGISLIFYFKGLLFLTILNLMAVFIFSGVILITVPHIQSEGHAENTMGAFQKIMSALFVLALFIGLCGTVLSVPDNSFKQAPRIDFTDIGASGLYLVVLFAVISLIGLMGIFHSRRRENE